ncbi:MAG TPA: TIGR03619 family F420-dependent LLM class oxidoreductase [Methylomirabilota bacterium]|jgi:probable F420-dependent oxidoreductase|nr:TIGR03619 family F420-dependent LLM class oxidoreductase [Methylomirabilota bacterium]
MTIKYRVGIMPGPWPPGRDGAAFLWTLCDMLERSDVDSIWLSDRLSSPAPVPEVMTTLAAIAARTTRLKFGPSVVVLPYRTPVVAAKEMATVDWLSQGRLFPAVGVGVELPREFDASGVAFAERGRRTDEAIRVMRLLWTQDEVTFQGDFYKLDRVSIFPKPWQTPPPIWIGGKSEAAMRRTARLGDGWIPSFITADEMRAGVEKVHDLAAAAGRQVPEDHFGTLINYAITDSEATALALAQPYVPRGRVDEATMRQCTAFGPAEHLIEKVEEYVKAGASKFILRPLCPPDRMLEQLALVAERVCPEFHRRSS